MVESEALRSLLHFLGANAFLLAMLLAGVGVALALARLAQFAGADNDLMLWLSWPIGLAGIVASYYAGKHAHRLLSRLI